jgi:hypothetical protein
MTTRIWSLADMLKMPIAEFLTAHSGIKAFGQTVVSQAPHLQVFMIDEQQYLRICGEVASFHSLCDQFGLGVTKKAAANLNAAISLIQKKPEDPSGTYVIHGNNYLGLRSALDGLAHCLKYESESIVGLVIQSDKQEFWEQSEPLFGSAVSASFKSAAYDIEEAGKCLALERGTACVMHVMRATEVSLKALANTLGVGPQNDWGAYIREIDKELDKRLKAAGKRSADEEFYAEATVVFGHVKRAWRNKSMHIDQIYTPERATEIFEATRSFMSHLATKISE